MADKNTLIVKINGQDYTIASQESRGYMLGVADLVDRKMKEVNHASPGMSTAMTAVLTALNLAEDYLRLKKEDDVLKKQAAQCAEQLRRAEAELERYKRNR